MGFISSLKNYKACLACETSEVVLTLLSIKYCVHEKVDVKEPIIENENAMYADKLSSEDIRQTWKPNLNSSRFSSVGKRRRRVCISSARYWESFPNRKKLYDHLYAART